MSITPERKAYLAIWREKNRTRLREYGRSYREENQEKTASYHAEYAKQNRVAIRRNYNKWRSNNPGKADQFNREYIARFPERVKERAKVYCMNNPKVVQANTRRRQLAKLKRTPVWADLKAIKQFYVNCPHGHQVDHIIPLQGKLVSGLHVLNNLQYLTPFDNYSKGNKFDPMEFVA